MTYQVNEIFNSIQGEGYFAGVPSTFIRLQGCTVGCPWCDTKHTWTKGGTKMAVEEILDRPIFEHVVVTGGEPTLWNLDALLVELDRMNCFVQLETSGQNELKGRLFPNWITWSPKEHLHYSMQPRLSSQANEVKFVVDSVLTKGYIDLALSRVPYVSKMIFMPEGAPPKEEFVVKALDFTYAYADRHKVRYSDRLHTRAGVR